MAPAEPRVRAFVALDLPADHRDALGGYLRHCAELARDYRWVPAANLHVTLRFLGHVSRPVLARVSTGLAGVVAGRFELRPGGLGKFGGRARPRVVWLGLEGDVGACAALASAVEAVCAGAGLAPDERPFRAHLTLARARVPGRSHLPALPPAPGLDAWTVTGFTLYESHLGRPTSEYRPLARFDLL